MTDNNHLLGVHDLVLPATTNYRFLYLSQRIATSEQHSVFLSQPKAPYLTTAV